MKKALPLITLIILAAIAILIRNWSGEDIQTGTNKTRNSTTATTSSSRGLNRNPAYINYSKHARCRMSCRHIDEYEVKQILTSGKINYGKSDLTGDECKKRYAVEGITRDNQSVRIIFAPCNSEVTVVTVIDLGKDWSCDCN